VKNKSTKGVVMPRLFIAINFSDGIKNRLLSVRDQIKAQSYKGNFSRPENLHLTLVFLGEMPEGQIPSICHVITAALTPPMPAFTLDFTRTGCYRHSNKELWWIGADNNNPNLGILTNIRVRLTGGLSEKGIAFDNRPFNPHVTLGREIKHNAPVILPEINVPLPVNRISLMKSEHINRILTYTEIFGQDLQR
jgi:2'-5' RNA ligase